MPEHAPPRTHALLWFLAALTPAMGAGCTRHADLFACHISLTCEQLYWHINPEPITALECAADLIRARERGAIRALDDPGGDGEQVSTEQVIIALGDGTALVQSREGKDAPSAQQICDFALDSRCTPEDCRWDPWHQGLVNCRDVDDRSCADVAAILGK